MQGTVTPLGTSRPTASHQIGAIANSSSPAPGPGRPMQGKVQGFDSRTGMGRIAGSDGTTFSFFGAGVLGGAQLSPGQSVEFNDNDGVATKIRPTDDAPVSAQSTIGGVANSASPPPGSGRPMKGIVQGFDARTGMGKIKGADGTTFSFFGAGVIGGTALTPGQGVEFNDNDGIATKIVATGSAPAAAHSTIGGVANSASPPPGPGRSMKGAVHGFDSRTGMGKIRGEDGATYSFFEAGVIGGAALSPGQGVEFNDKDGIATKIVPTAGAGPTRQSTIGAVSNSASPPPSPGRPMRGTIVGFDARTGMGKIKGDDETTYSFYGAGVIGGKPLKKGRKVTFTDKDGIAVGIKPMRGRMMRILFGP